MPPIVPPAPLDLPAPAEPTRSLLRSATPLPAWPRPGAPVAFRPACGDGRVGLFDLCDASPDKDVPDAEGTRIWQPFGAWAGDECSTRTWREPGMDQRARQYLAAYRSAQIAAEFWLGTIAEAENYDDDGQLWLAHEDVVELTSGGVGTVTTLALLEQALAGCAGQGVIHAAPDLVTLWTADGLLDVSGGNLTTRAMGTLVITDAGYPGTGPGATGSAPPGTSWAYGTTRVYRADDAPVVYPDPTSTAAWAEAIDRSNNTVAWRAEQAVLVLWDGCCHVAAEADLTDRS